MVFRFGRVAKTPDAAARLADVEHEVTAAHAEPAAAWARIAQLTTEPALLGQPPDLLTRERDAWQARGDFDQRQLRQERPLDRWTHAAASRTSMCTTAHGPPTVPAPGLGPVGLPLLGAGTQMAAQREPGLLPEGQGARTPPLADHVSDVLGEVEVGDGEPGDLDSRPPVSSSSRMMAALRRSTNGALFAEASSARSCASVTTGTGFSGTMGGRIRSIGDRSISSSSSHRISCCSAR
jgi:hypothetical protein